MRTEKASQVAVVLWVLPLSVSYFGLATLPAQPAVRHLVYRGQQKNTSVACRFGNGDAWYSTFPSPRKMIDNP